MCLLEKKMLIIRWIHSKAILPYGAAGTFASFSKFLREIYYPVCG